MIISHVEVAATPRPRRLPWWGTLLIAVCASLMLACVGTAVPSLQAPAGPVLCRDGNFVAGSRSHPTDDGTGYDVDSSCRSAATGQSEHLDSFAILGVLWAEYTVAGFVALSGSVALVRAARRTPREDHTDRGETSGFRTL